MRIGVGAALRVLRVVPCVGVTGLFCDGGVNRIVDGQVQCHHTVATGGKGVGLRIVTRGGVRSAVPRVDSASLRRDGFGDRRAGQSGKIGACPNAGVAGRADVAEPYTIVCIGHKTCQLNRGGDIGHRCPSTSRAGNGVVDRQGLQAQMAAGIRIGDCHRIGIDVGNLIMHAVAVDGMALSIVHHIVDVGMIGRPSINFDARDDNSIGSRDDEIVLSIDTEGCTDIIVGWSITCRKLVGHKRNVVVKVDNHAIEGLFVGITLLGEIKGIVHILVRSAVGHVLQFRGIGTIVRPNHLGGIHGYIVHRQLDGSTAYKLFRAERNNTAPIAGVAHGTDGAHLHLIAGLRIKV